MLEGQSDPEHPHRHTSAYSHTSCTHTCTARPDNTLRISHPNPVLSSGGELLLARGSADVPHQEHNRPERGLGHRQWREIPGKDGVCFSPARYRRARRSLHCLGELTRAQALQRRTTPSRSWNEHVWMRSRAHLSTHACTRPHALTNLTTHVRQNVTDMR